MQEDLDYFALYYPIFRFSQNLPFLLIDSHQNMAKILQHTLLSSFFVCEHGLLSLTSTWGVSDF